MAPGAQGWTHRPQPVHRRLDAHEGQIDLATARPDLLAAAGDVDGRTADIDAVAAAGAFVVDDLVGLQLVIILDQHAGLVGDDDRHPAP